MSVYGTEMNGDNEWLIHTQILYMYLHIQLHIHEHEYR